MSPSRWNRLKTVTGSLNCRRALILAASATGVLVVLLLQEFVYSRTQAQVLQQITSLGGGCDTEPLALSWLAKYLPFVESSTVVRVHLNNTTVSNDLIRSLPQIHTIKHLDLGNTAITDFSPLAKLRDLQYLDVSFSSLTDEQCMYIGSIASLETLRAESTTIGDRGVGHLSGCAKLRELYIRDTHVVGRSFGTLPCSLEVLDISHTRVTDETVSCLFHLGRLRSLSMSGTSVSDTIAGDVIRLRALTHLDVSGSNVTDATVLILARWGQLREVSFEWTDVRPKAIAQFHVANPLCRVSPRPDPFWLTVP